MANLLPKTTADFTSKDYWDSFFTQRGSSFEWYGEYHQLSPVIFKYAKMPDRTLVVGCGNSTMSHDLHQSGYKNLVSIDISDVVIKQMLKKYPKLDFRVMDASKLQFDDAEFGVVIDKGTVDALLPLNNSKESVDTVERVLCEVSRCLRVGGRFLCVTLLQQQVADTLLGFFNRGRQDNFTWVIRVHRCVEAEGDTRQKLVLPVYVVVVTKMMRLPLGPCVLESMMSVDAKPTRFVSVEALLEDIKKQQSYAFLRSHMTRSCLDREYKTELYSEDGNTRPKYELFIVDTPGADRKSGLKFACFIVPEGRECEWLFGTPEGRKLAAKQCEAYRVVFVHLSRHFTYASTDQVKDELSGPVSQLTPHNFRHGAQIPFLSVGEATGNRTVVEKGHSAISGEFIVEDVTVDGEVYRRLIFLDRPSVIQTEIRLRKNKPDYTYLTTGYYKYMIAAIGFFGNEHGEALLLGLGGSILALFVAKCAKWKIQAVELDQAILDVAAKYFGLVKEVDTHCGDALEFVKTSTKVFDIIWLDIDSKDVGQALTCPSEEFLDKAFLKDVSSLLSVRGVFVVNLACRDDNKCKHVYKVIGENFTHVKVIDVPEMINHVIYASNGNLLECNAKEVRSLLKRSNKDNDIENLENMFRKIEL